MTNKYNLKKIGVIGLGYVGLPLALSFGKVKNFLVYGFDNDKFKVKSIKQGKSYISHISSSHIKTFIKKNKVSDNFSHISELDIIFLCLPTPLKKGNKPDLSYIKNCLNIISPYLRKGQTISLESSTYPGTTDEIIVKKLKKKFNLGSEFNIIYSPEREDPGNKIKMNLIPKVVSGYTKRCEKIAKFYYSKVFSKVVLAKDLKTAEFSKILENVYRSINIGLVNEIKTIADKMNLDIFDIIKVAATKPFGFVPFYPGPGVGGHCIPLDPFYLTWKAKKFGLNTKFIKIAHQINSDIKNWIISKLENKLKIIKKKKILIIGISYKKNVDDCRESPSLDIISELQKKEAYVSYYDPYVVKIPDTRKHKLNLKSVRLNKKNIQNFDCVLILTDHDNINYKLIKNNSKLIFDSRGIFKTSKKILRV